MAVFSAQLPQKVASPITMSSVRAHPFARVLFPPLLFLDVSDGQILVVQ